LPEKLMLAAESVPIVKKDIIRFASIMAMMAMTAVWIWGIGIMDFTGRERMHNIMYTKPAVCIGFLTM